MTTMTFECTDCHESGDIDGAYTGPDGTASSICGPCLDHLDARTWTKDTLTGHLDDVHGGCLVMTKRDLVAAHRERHVLAAERAARLAELGGTIAYLRGTFACQVTDHSFSVSDGPWIEQHVSDHVTGNTREGRLL